ncbi:hypothetical protein O8W32_06635 [Methanomassiliicoccales archaeon LGM-DZ1]|nr:hypothetical protein O8W32_06635 [Methanomassiliicoccales archaeon LGM-DZ1]
MITIAELLRLRGGDDFDVYDSVVETGFECAYEQHIPDRDKQDDEDYYYDFVCAWIQERIAVERIYKDSVTADIWGFVEKHIPLFRKISEHATISYQVRGDDDDSITAAIAICQCLEVGDWPCKDYGRIAKLIGEECA